jgi:hypothetical protein
MLAKVIGYGRSRAEAAPRLERALHDARVHWGPEEAANRVTGPALDFCLLVTQRRHRDDTAVTATGATADQWLSIAQSFAGPPGPGRRPGQFAGLRADDHAAQPGGTDG